VGDASAPVTTSEARLGVPQNAILVGPPDAQNGPVAASRYRADIDGLRAIAVMSVIGFHAFPGLVSGGYVGVDIFFVISGFLITTILLTDLDRGRFSFVGFYARRIRRIFPALILMLAVSLSLGWFLFFAVEYKGLGERIAEGAGFIVNLVLLDEENYFRAGGTWNPLRHLWSLGVEEQFYIVWPILLYLGVRLGRRGLPIIFLTIIIISFAIDIETVEQVPKFDFYSPFTRFWELGAGAVLAYASLYPYFWEAIAPARINLSFRRWFGGDQPRQRLSELGALCGIVFVAIAIFALDDHAYYPGWWAVLPVSGTFLLLAAGSETYLNRWLLANRVLVWIGLISYPLYLWHWPLLSFARIAGGGMSQLEKAVLVAISVPLSALTYWFVEKPIRFGRHREGKTIALVLLLGCIGGTGYFIASAGGLPFREGTAESLMSALYDWQRVPTEQRYHGIPAWIVGNPEAADEVFLGDSNMAQYYPRLLELTRNKLDMVQHHIVLMTLGGCPPIPDISRPNEDCAAFSDRTTYLLREKTVGKVILAALWDNYFRDGQTYLRSDGPTHPLDESEASQSRALEKIGDRIGQLVKDGKRVFVILEIPNAAAFAVSWPTGWSRLRQTPKTPESVARAVGEIASKAGATVIDPMDFLCDQSTCPAMTEAEEPIYRDSDHLRATFVQHHATYIDQIFH
jgi:peptidoglycan/LPS O-acetylase OafA/YrhL